MPAQGLRTPVAKGLGITPLIGACRDTVYYVFCYKQTKCKKHIFHLGSSCGTVGGQRRVSNPDPDKPCIFPFIWSGVSHSSCINDADGNWCSTQVNRRGEYIDKKWGICSSTCPGKSYR